MEVPIIAMTADGFETDIGMLQKAGMNGLISKPVDVNTLVEHITNWQGGKHSASFACILS